MVTLRTRPVGSFGVGEGSGSGLGVRQLDDQTREFISSEITCSILDQTPVIFGTIKEGILELLDERLSAFHTEVAAMMGPHTLTFREFKACGAPDYHGLRAPLRALDGWKMSPMYSTLTDVPRGTRVDLYPVF